MLSQAQFEKVGLFFALTLLNQKQAAAAAGRVIAAFKVAALLKNTKAAEATDEKLIRSCCAILKKFAGQTLPNDMGEGFFRRQIDLIPWQRFCKEAEEEEVLAVLLTRVLQFSELDISRALDVKPGTIHYRTAKGTSRLGLLSRVQ